MASMRSVQEARILQGVPERQNIIQIRHKRLHHTSHSGQRLQRRLGLTGMLCIGHLALLWLLSGISCFTIIIHKAIELSRTTRTPPVLIIRELSESGLAHIF